MGRSTGYILGFAAAVCLICGVFVSSAAVALKDRQEANKKLDRQQKVLVVAGLMKEGAGLSADEVQKIFDESIVPKVVDFETHWYDETTDAKTYDQRKATSDPAQSHTAVPGNPGLKAMPNKALIYQVIRNKKVVSIILPIEGKGLWSTLYGFLALDKDTKTIKGITFYEHGETPGLGGEIDNPKWKGKWVGQLAYDAEWKPAAAVRKGQAASTDLYGVDGLSGATLTSNGVTRLVQFWLGEHAFGPFLKAVREKGGN